MSLSDGIETKVYIGGVVSGDVAASTLITGQTWVEVKEIESVGEIGITAADINFTSLSAGKVRHRKGAIDYGSYQITAGKVPDDPGQLAMSAAARTRYNYAVRIVESDAATEGHTDTEHLFVGLIGNDRVAAGQSNSVTKRSWNLMVNDWHEVPSEVTP